MTEVQTFTRQLFQELSLTGSTSVLLMLVMYILAAWLVCVAAAFCRVRETKYYVGLLSVGMTIVVSLLLAGICRYYLPDLAASFTPLGLLVFCSTVGVFVFSVPLLQCFWRTTYLQGFFCMAGGISLFIGVIVVFQLMMHPIETVPGRIMAPMFESNPVQFSP